MITWRFTTVSIKQKNISSKNWTGLNGFAAEQLLYAMKYKRHRHLMVEVVNKRSALPQYPYKFQKVTKYALFYSFVIVVEIQVHLNKLECRGKVHLFQ